MKEHVISLLDSYTSSRIINELDSECITWTGRLSIKKGRDDFFPIMKTKKTWLSVPRYTWKLVRGNLSKYDKLRNTCGNKCCINPYHYDNKTLFCPKGHPRNEKNVYPSRQVWINASGEEIQSLAVSCRSCKVEENRLSRRRKKLL